MQHATPQTKQATNTTHGQHIARRYHTMTLGGITHALRRK